MRVGRMELCHTKSRLRSVSDNRGSESSNSVRTSSINTGVLLADPNERDAIISAMRTMENLTAVDGVLCVQFRERVVSDATYYINIYNGTGCSSYVSIADG